MELSTEHQSINQCMLKHELIKQIYLMIVDMTCRSKIYQSIEQKIVMGGTTVRNSDTMKACLTEEQLVYTISHDILQTIHKQIDNQLKSLSHDILQTIHKQIDNQLKPQRLDELIEQFRTNEKQLQDLKNEINMELSTEHQSINQCMLKCELIKQIYLMIVDMKCRSKIYQSIEQKIVMGVSHDILQTIHKQIDNQLKSR
ncbi:unnamed protein product [Schistosoma bovis]|nr:unnamed protein product [Schistosoma bovis]